MLIAGTPHEWGVSTEEAKAIQMELRESVEPVSTSSEIRTVAGLDGAAAPDGVHYVAGVVLWNIREGAVMEERIALGEMSFPYVPGLLSFRELPSFLAVLAEIQTRPDALMCDGHGIAHPRRFGLACHLGVLAGIPSVGCAKNLLCGTYEEPGQERGNRSPLREENEIIGTVLRTRSRVRPLFVSIGHRVDLMAAERIVLDCGAGFRLPEPVRRAHHLVSGATTRESRFGSSTGAGHQQQP
jgi:deoxyribonuclease V